MQKKSLKIQNTHAHKQTNKHIDQIVCVFHSHTPT